jgi:hypothetical protein
MEIKYFKTAPQPNNSVPFVIEEIVQKDNSTGQKLSSEKFNLKTKYKKKTELSGDKKIEPSKIKYNVKLENTKNKEFTMLLYPEDMQKLIEEISQIAISEEYPKHKGKSKQTEFSFMCDFLKVHVVVEEQRFNLFDKFLRLFN